MKTYLEFIQEHVLNSFGEHDRAKLLDKHYDELHSIISKSYEYAGGYSGLGTGTPEEHKAIHDDLHHPDHIIKATKRAGKISYVNIYRKQYGRKSIGAATDQSPQGKKDFIQGKKEDIKMHDRHAWGEVSDKAEAIMNKLGAKEVSHDKAEKLTGKQILKKHDDGVHYDRKIGPAVHTKKIVWKPFRGGASVANSSHFFVEIAEAK